MTTSPEKIVRDFCDAWGRKNIDELMSFFDADAVYHNIPVRAVTGTEAIRAAFMAFASLMETIKLELLGLHRMATSCLPSVSIVSDGMEKR